MTHHCPEPEDAAPLGGAGADANTPAMLGNASVGDEAAKAGLPDAFSRAKDNCGSFELALQAVLGVKQPSLELAVGDLA